MGRLHVLGRGREAEVVAIDRVVGDAPRAVAYLKESGTMLTPDRIHEILNLQTSRATLGRKLRAYSEGENSKLLRYYYTNPKGRRIAMFYWNPDYKENK